MGAYCLILIWDICLHNNLSLAFCLTVDVSVTCTSVVNITVELANQILITLLNSHINICNEK